MTEEEGVKVRAGEARKIVDLPPDTPKEGQIIYKKEDKHPYVFIKE